MFFKRTLGDRRRLLQGAVDMLLQGFRQGTVENHTAHDQDTDQRGAIP